MSDAVGGAGDVRVERNCHYAGRVFALGQQGVQGVLGAAVKFGSGMMLHQIDGDVVEFHSVGDGHQAAGGYFQLVGLVIVDPVGHIFNALRGQQVGGLPGFGQAGAHPAARGVAAEVADDPNGLADGGALVRFLMQHLLGVAVSHQFPAPFQARLGQLRVMFADGGVEADGGGQPVGVQGLLQAPETDAQPVVKPGVVGDVGGHGGALGRGQNGARHGLGDVPFLHIDDEPDGNAGAIGQQQRRAVKNGGVVGARVGHRRVSGGSWAIGADGRRTGATGDG